jgi:hypothetical protein
MKSVAEKPKRAKRQIRVIGSGVTSVTRIVGGQVVARESISAVPSKEAVIAMIRRLGVAAVYPQHAGKSLEQTVEDIERTPDAEWYPADDVFWKGRGEVVP